eukprot:COSAG06_NODE_5194_length_3646_cov_7.440372_2_plen_145_part_00
MLMHLVSTLAFNLFSVGARALSVYLSLRRVATDRAKYRLRTGVRVNLHHILSASKSNPSSLFFWSSGLPLAVAVVVRVALKVPPFAACDLPAWLKLRVGACPRGCKNGGSDCCPEPVLVDSSDRPNSFQQWLDLEKGAKNMDDC